MISTSQSEKEALESESPRTKLPPLPTIIGHVDYRTFDGVLYRREVVGPFGKTVARKIEP